MHSDIETFLLPYQPHWQHFWYTETMQRFAKVTQKNSEKTVVKKPCLTAGTIVFPRKKNTKERNSKWEKQMESSDKEIHITQNSFSSSKDVLPEVDLLDHVLFDEVCFVESLLETTQMNRVFPNEAE